MDPTEELMGQDTPGAVETTTAPAPDAWTAPPRERWNELYGNVKRYKEFGDPDEVSSKLEKLEQYERAIEEARRKGNGQAVSQEEAEHRERVKKQLEAIYPQLRNLDSVLESSATIPTLQSQLKEMNLQRASTYLGSKLSANKLNVEPELQDLVEDAILGRLSARDRQRLEQGDTRVIDDALDDASIKKLLAKLGTPAAPPSPPKRHGPSEAPRLQPKVGPKSLNDAADEAWGQIEAARKG